MNTAIVPTLCIRTPEGISFNLLLAGVVPRFLAWLIDVAGVAVLMFGASIVMGVFAAISPGLIGAVYTLIYFVVSIGYGIVFEWFWRGQTPGKRVFRLRVMDVQGLHLQFSQIGIRNLLRAVDLLPGFYLLGGAVCYFNKRCQRLGDIAANTIVVRYPQLDRPEVEDLTGNKYNSLRDYPHLEARLRQSITPAEAALALEAVLRAKTLDATARIEVFEELAAHYRKIVEFPPEATELISAEQYVRNVVDVIYSPMRRISAETGSVKSEKATL